MAEELSKEDQALLDQMRDADAQPGSEAPEAEAPVAPAPAEPLAETRDTRVPYGALSEERQIRKRLEGELAEERQRIRTLEERTNLLLNQRFNQQQAPQPPAPVEPAKPAIPELDKDPVGHILGTQRQLASQLEQNQQNWNQQSQQADQHMRMLVALQQLTGRAKAVEEQFAIEHPDYPQAVQHLTRTRHLELARIGYTDPAERAQFINQEGLGIAARMFQINGNPAEAIYELARMRGYAAPAQSNPPEPTQSVPPTETNAAAEHIANLQRGQQQSRSLSDARGSGPQPLTARRLLEMSEVDFAKTLETDAGMELLGRGA